MKTNLALKKRSLPAKRKKRRGWTVFWLILLIVVLIPVIYYGSYLLFRGPLPGKVSVIAHRGGATLAPENTLTAFSKAAQVRADGFELDIQMSKDGALVVMHDDTVDRTTNGNGAVKDLSFTELRDLTVNGTAAGEGERIPTFAEALSLAKQSGLEVYAEIKSPHLYPGLEVKMLEAVKEAGYGPRTKFLSFESQALETAATLEPELPLIALYGLFQFQLGKTHPGGAKIIAPMAEMILLYPWMVKAAHARGEKVIAWTGKIENEMTMRMLRAIGVDGMIVNNPSLLIKVL